MNEIAEAVDVELVVDAAASRQVDRGAAQRAAADLLRALGADLESEGLRDTPRRMVQAYVELLTPKPFQPTTFPNEGGYDELVLVRAIPFHSLCMHHMLPFQGSPTSAICRGSGSSASRSWPGPRRPAHPPGVPHPDGEERTMTQEYGC
jgi:hypothetical protein